MVMPPNTGLGVKSQFVALNISAGSAIATKLVVNKIQWWCDLHTQYHVVYLSYNPLNQKGMKFELGHNASNAVLTGPRMTPEVLITKRRYP